jgi:histidyl-tRNA synthetase
MNYIPCIKVRSNNLSRSKEFMAKVSTPKGTRDFSPIVLAKRNYIFDTIRKVYQTYGFMPLETPSMENLSTLTGKYGDEGDRLIFKILNSGNYLKKADKKAIEDNDSKALIKTISEKGLRYDLTVPFARFVAQNQNDIAFPFKRFQIQPVWRADRPQKGRYREFFQCDADVVGNNSLLCEVELIQIYHEVFNKLNLSGLTISLNNRKILAGIAEVLGAKDKLIDLTVAIDKLDKIGKDKVFEELISKGFSEENLNKISPLFELNGSSKEKISKMKEYLSSSAEGLKGLEELEYVYDICTKFDVDNLEFDVTLARGLDYYTGAIFEIKVNDGSMGSLGGGGRYDNLTEVFGLKDISGVGISFGADRIYDVMDSRELFPDTLSQFLEVIFINFGEESSMKALSYLKELRSQNIKAELYPSNAKMKKQMKYADARNTKFVVLLGEDEIQRNVLSVKNMEDGSQSEMSIEELIKTLK